MNDRQIRMLDMLNYIYNYPTGETITLQHCGEFDVEAGFGSYWCPYCGKQVTEPPESYEREKEKVEQYDKEEEEHSHQVLNDRLETMYEGNLYQCRRYAKFIVNLDRGTSSFHYIVIDSETTETIELWHFCCGAARVGDCPNCKAEREMDR